jgi:putative phosphoesterase
VVASANESSEADRPEVDVILGIVSDTHGWTHPRLTSVMEGADLIVHAGDVGRVEILDELALVAPVRAVYGNVDGYPVRGQYPEWDRFDADGLSVLVTHIAGRPGRWAPGVAEVIGQSKPDLFICGHSHILQIERIDEPARLLFINPGAAGREGLHRVKTCVRLTIEGGKAREAEVIHLDGEPATG